jgi:hypothetical protein
VLDIQKADIRIRHIAAQEPFSQENRRARLNDRSEFLEPKNT